MSILTFVIGMTLSSLAGWMLVRLTEGRSPVLFPLERVLYGTLLGPIGTMEFLFIGTSLGIMRFTLAGFLLAHAVMVLLPAAMLWRRKILTFRPAVAEPVSGGLPQKKWQRYGLFLLLVWAGVRFAFGAFNLTQLPTYWDDTIDNWNMRGKAFFLEQDILLEIPNSNGTVTSKEGESSYPAAIPLMKTWLSVLRGTWSDGLVNAVHALWYLCLIGIAYFTLRRHAGTGVSLLGAYLIGSQPLVLIQGVNPYGDILVAACLTAAVGALLQAASQPPASSRTWLLLSALAIGIGVFTKNEVLVLHLPPIVLGVALVGKKSTTMKTLLTAMAIVTAFVLPWLLFKWSNGLTFGNAKAATGITIGWHPEALRAMWNMLAKEPNFLLLPLMTFLAVVAGWRVILRSPLVILLFFLLAVLGAQTMLYLFTSLSVEAVQQTGMGRGFLQLAPLATILVVLTADHFRTRGDV